MLVAIWALIVAYRRGYSVELKQYGPILGFLGVMSFLYHLSNFYGSQILDFVGMFAFIGWVIGMNLIRLGKLDGNRLLRFILMLNVGLIGVMQGMRMLGLKSVSYTHLDVYKRQAQCHHITGRFLQDLCGTYKHSWSARFLIE